MRKRHFPDLCLHSFNNKRGRGRSLFDKIFYMKTRETFLSSNCEATLSSDFHSDKSNFEGWGSTLVAYKRV